MLLAADQGGFFSRTWPWAALAFGAVAALALLTSGELRTRRAALVFVTGLAALAAWTACSVLWSSEPQISLQEAVRTPVYVAAALALTILAAADGSTAILFGFVAGATGTAAYSLVDRLAHGAHRGDQQATLLERPLGYANALGALCAIALVVALTLVLGARGRSRSRPAATAAGVISAAVLAIALVLTQSRAAWAAGALGLAVVVAATAPRRRLAIAAAASAGLAIVALSVVPAVAIPATLQARGDYWHVAWRVAGDHPLLGTGAGTYDLAWTAFGNLARWGPRWMPTACTSRL